MTYDYHGQWDKITGHVAPMYPHPDDVDVTFNAVSHHIIFPLHSILKRVDVIMKEIICNISTDNSRLKCLIWSRNIIIRSKVM